MEMIVGQSYMLVLGESKYVGFFVKESINLLYFSNWNIPLESDNLISFQKRKIDSITHLSVSHKDLEDVRQLIQDDLITVLDGIGDDFITQVCDLVIERFKPLFGEKNES
jgi:hypothetical protein